MVNWEIKGTKSTETGYENAHSPLPRHRTHYSSSSQPRTSIWYVLMAHGAHFSFHLDLVNHNVLSKDDFLFGNPTPQTMKFTWNPRSLQAKGVQLLTFLIRAEEAPTAFPTLTYVKTGRLLLTALKPFTRYYVNVTALSNVQTFVNLGHFDTRPNGIWWYDIVLTRKIHLAPTWWQSISTISESEIEVTWVIADDRKGILLPYMVKCEDEHGRTIGPFEAPIEVRSIRISHLEPSTTYNCTMTASIKPADGQDPEECRSIVNLPPTRTLERCASRVHLILVF